MTRWGLDLGLGIGAGGGGGGSGIITPPSFVAASSTAYGSRVNTTLAQPAGTANGDGLLFLLFMGQGFGPPDPGLPDGVVELDTPISEADASTFQAKLRMFSKRADNEPAEYTFAHASAATQCAILSYRNIADTGSFINVWSKAQGLGGTSTGNSITTTEANQMLLWGANDWKNDLFPTPPLGYTERFRGLINLSEKLAVAPGNSGTPEQTTTNGGPQPWGVWMLGIKGRSS